MGVRTRRLRGASVESGLPENTGYCRKCMKVKRGDEFHKAVDINLDSNGLFSVCKSCMDTIYENILTAENGSVQRSVLSMCRMFNIAYNEKAIEAALKQIETKKSDARKLFGYYRAKLIMVMDGGMVNSSGIDLSFKDNITINYRPDLILEISQDNEMRDLAVFWGTYNKEDIEFLENEFANFKQTHQADTYAEVVLLKEVCYKLLDIHKAREEKKSTEGLLKQLMEVMKNLAISPNMSNAASGGKSMDSFGMWLKEISEMRPEEWVEDKSAYKDVDNFEDYNERILISPMRALVTGSKEFTLESDESLIGDEEGE